MTDEAVHRHSPSEAKIALFRSLFRGRDDVCARRFESKKTDKAGYQPACGNEWDRVLCDKRRVKSPVCQNRRFLPLTDEVIRRHLSGRDETGKDIVVGVYPMLQDETCFFLAVDFDKKSWSEDAGAYLETSRQLGLTACLERSRSGCGGRIWLFFQKPIPAALARKLGSHILTETMEPRPDIGLDSYDRLIPNQDTLPTGGFGNLIAQRRVNTLVPVHRRQLMEQWVDRLSAFLGSPMKAIGSIGSGKKKPIGMVDVALIQSLVRKGWLMTWSVNTAIPLLSPGRTAAIRSSSCSADRFDIAWMQRNRHICTPLPTQSLFVRPAFILRGRRIRPSKPVPSTLVHPGNPGPPGLVKSSTALP